MNILHVSTRLKPTFGGGERFVQDLIRALPEHQHTFVGDHPVLVKIFREEGFEAHQYWAGFEPIGPKKTLLAPISFILAIIACVRFRKLIKESDIVVCDVSSLCEPIFLFPLLRKFFNKKLVFLNHWGNVPAHVRQSPLIKHFGRVMNYSNPVFVSNSQKTVWQNEGLAGENPITIYNGVKIHNFVPKKQLDAKKIVLGFMARVDELKGFDVFIKALALIKNPNYELKIILAGEGAYKNEYIELQSSLQFDPKINIEWRGFVVDTKSFYESLDVFVFPSKAESFGLVMVEGWERGLPVISSDLPALIELKKYAPEPESMITFKTNSPESLAKAIEYFIANQNKFLNSEYSQQLHDLAEKQFSTARMANNYDKLFQKVINEV